MTKDFHHGLLAGNTTWLPTAGSWINTLLGDAAATPITLIQNWRPE